MADATRTPRVSRQRRRAVLGVMCLALMMVVAAVASLNVALPNLARDTGASQDQLQWIVDAYALVFAGLLLPAGALGDRFGRKGVLLSGLLIFGAVSLSAIFVTDPSTLIGLRALIGLGAALVMPTTLSIITNVFPEDERGRAVGIWAGIAGGGAVIGLLLSGTLLEWFSWRSVFAINVTLAALAIATTIPIVPTSRSQRQVRLDPVGARLSSLGLFGIVFATIEAPLRGWLDALTLTGFAVGGLLLVGFVFFELARREPMLDPRLFARRGFGVGSLSLTMQFFAQFGLLFVTLQYLQFVLGYSPFQAGVSILPMAFMLVLLSPRAPALATRIGVRTTGGLGLAIMAVGFYVFSTLDTDSSYLRFGLAAVVAGLGIGLATAPATTAITSALPAHRQGIASAVNDLSREVGGALGIAVLGSVLNIGYRNGIAPATAQLPPKAAGAAQDSIAAVAQHAPHAGRQGAVLQNCLLVAAAVLLAAAVIVAVLAPRREQIRQRQPTEQEHPARQRIGAAR